MSERANASVIPFKVEEETEEGDVVQNPTEGQNSPLNPGERLHMAEAIRMAEAIVNRGSIFLVQHRPQAAAANFERALMFNPAHPEKVYFNRALAREEMGDLGGAYADYAQAAKLAPQWEQPKREMIRFTIVRQKPTS